MAWTDPNLKDFEGRIRRIEKARRKGYGFEAAGAPGLSAHYRREARLGHRLAVVAIVLALAIVAKGAILFVVGEEPYHQRVAAMATGDGVAPFAARLMDVDPVSRLVASFIGQVFPAKG